MPVLLCTFQIFTDGALFSVGDGHGAQGDGEVCVTAIETGLVGTFCLTLRNDMRLEWPLAETPTHMITMAFDPDPHDCVVTALRQMIDLICARTGLDRYQAYALSSLAADDALRKGGRYAQRDRVNARTALTEFSPDHAE